jgi:phytoene dehydrogenase-like protein
MRAVVIGAGFAGLAAALRLRLAGLEVAVLDKQEAPGGKAIGWNGVPTGPTVLTLPEVPRTIFQALGGRTAHARAGLAAHPLCLAGRAHLRPPG